MQFHKIQNLIHKLIMTPKNLNAYKKFSYFLNIFFILANYDPAEDEHYRRSNGHVPNGGEFLNNNNEPITVQPSRLQRNMSANRYENHRFLGERKIIKFFFLITVQKSTKTMSVEKFKQPMLIYHPR